MKSVLVSYFLFVLCLSSIDLNANEKWTYVETKNDVRVFKSKSNELGSIIPFKAEADIEGSFDDIVRVLLNYENKPNWAPKLLEVSVHEKLSPRSYVFSEIYFAPWPFQSREFLLIGLTYP